MGILEKISEIEKEIARTQKNKGEHRIDVVTLSSLTCPFALFLSIAAKALCPRYKKSIKDLDPRSV